MHGRYDSATPGLKASEFLCQHLCSVDRFRLYVPIPRSRLKLLPEFWWLWGEHPQQVPVWGGISALCLSTLARGFTFSQSV